MDDAALRADGSKAEFPTAHGKRQPLTRELRADLALALLTMLFLVLPLYRTGVLEDSFITPKFFLLVALGLAAGLSKLFMAVQSPAARWLSRCSLSGLAFTALVVWHAVAVTWAPAQGLARSSLAWWLGFLALFHLIRVTARSVRAMTALWGAAVIAAAVTALWTVIEDAGRGTLSGVIVARLPDWRGYLSAGLGNSGHIAGYIGYCLPAAVVWFLLRRRLSVVGLIGLLTMFAALVVTWSVGSTGSALISLMIWGAVATRCNLSRALHWRRLTLLVIAGVAVAAFYLPAHPLNPHPHGLWAEAFASERWKEGGPTRLAIYLTTWHMIRNHLLLGVGAGNFTHAYVQQIVPEVADNPRLSAYAGAFTNDAHNEYLHIWCETGLPGLLLLGLVIVLFFYELRKTLCRCSPRTAALAVAAGGAMTALLLDAMMTFPMRLPAHMAMLILALATIPALSCGTQSCAISGWRLRGLVGAMVIAPFLISGTFHARRVAAEYVFKRARATAESGITIAGGGVVSIWVAAEGLFQEAANLMALGRATEARNLLDKVASLCREPVMVEARDLMRRSLAWDPDYTNASSRYGALLLMSGDYPNARHWLIRTLRNLQAPEVHERLGFAYYLDTAATPEARAQAVEAAHRHWRIVASRRPVMREYLLALIRATGGHHD